METYFKKVDSPIGILYVVASSNYLVGLTPEKGWTALQRKFDKLTEGENNITNKTQHQLNEYFSGIRHEFNIPLSLNGTSFQKSAWTALLDIPYGKTICYADQAINIGNPKAVRAIGRANGANPISIVVPCHRVIGKNGKLTGYASGIDIKGYLLELEKCHSK